MRLIVARQRKENPWLRGVRAKAVFAVTAVAFAVVAPSLFATGVAIFVRKSVALPVLNVGTSVVFVLV